MNVIYEIRCIPNNKFYIGSTVNKNQRWARHRRDLRNGAHKNTNMQASWNKYGESAFVFSVLEVVQETAQLMLVEQQHLDRVVGQLDCFNHNKFADSPWRGKKGEGTPNFGRPMDVATRAKISSALSGKNHPNWGKTPPKSVVEKIRAANKAYPHYEYRHTDEAKAKIAHTSKARVQSEAEKEKRRASMQGHEVSSLTRAKISATLSGEGNFWYGKKRPDHGAKVSRAVQVTDSKGNTETFDSITALREELKLTPPTVNRALKSGQPISRGPLKGWVFKYVATA